MNDFKEELYKEQTKRLKLEVEKWRNKYNSSKGGAKFNKEELTQIYYLVIDNIEEGTYSGNKEHWHKRNLSIIKKIEEA